MIPFLNGQQCKHFDNKTFHDWQLKKKLHKCNRCDCRLLTPTELPWFSWVSLGCVSKICQTEHITFPEDLNYLKRFWEMLWGCLGKKSMSRVTSIRNHSAEFNVLPEKLCTFILNLSGLIHIFLSYIFNRANISQFYRLSLKIFTSQDSLRCCLLNLGHYFEFYFC